MSISSDLATVRIKTRSKPGGDHAIEVGAVERGRYYTRSIPVVRLMLALACPESVPSRAKLLDSVKAPARDRGRAFPGGSRGALVA